MRCKCETNRGYNELVKRKLLPWAVSAFMTAPAFADGPGKVQIISAADLANNLSRYRVLEARELLDFRRGHIPGSLRVDWKDWTEQRPSFWNSLFGSSKLWGRVNPISGA